MMTDEAKSILLAIEFKGWHKEGGYWADKRGKLHATATSGASTLLPRWEPFENVAQAEAINDIMALRLWHLSLEGDEKDGYHAQYTIPDLTTQAVTRESMAAAICEAAGVARGMWEAGR